MNSLSNNNRELSSLLCTKQQKGGQGYKLHVMAFGHEQAPHTAKLKYNTAFMFVEDYVTYSKDTIYRIELIRTEYIAPSPQSLLLSTRIPVNVDRTSHDKD